MIKPGCMVRYIGEDLVTYRTGKCYLVVAYDEELDMYGVMSELDEAYYVDGECLEELPAETEKQSRSSEA